MTLRYWSSLRAAAGTTEEVVDAGTLADALASARRLHGAEPRFSTVLGICSVVVDGAPVGRHDHAAVALADGSVVELLPPFAGG
ncbi:MAG TPA: MoaD/ThiS family protein [Jiangellaceae bacterium]|nr:MoaD/ThiS family protein [Jiangellaceae bacterium]